MAINIAHGEVMKFILLIISSFIFVTSLEAKESAAQKGLRIAREVEKAQSGFKTETSDIEMQLINAYGEKVIRKMNSQTIEGNGSDGDKSLIEFIYPADVKGTKLLTWAHDDKDDDQWLYLPAFKRVKRIASSVKSGSFMGSEFTYEDLGGQSIEKYNFKWIKDDKLDGVKLSVVERIPKESNSGYSKQIVWFDLSKHISHKVEYYDRKSELLKTAIFKEPKKVGKYWRSMHVEMSNHQTRKKSILIWSNRELGKSLKSSNFNASRLK